MTIRSVVIRGFGNGNFSGTVAKVSRRGYDSGIVVIAGRFDKYLSGYIRSYLDEYDGRYVNDKEFK